MRDARVWRSPPRALAKREPQIHLSPIPPLPSSTTISASSWSDSSLRINTQVTSGRNDLRKDDYRRSILRVDSTRVAHSTVHDELDISHNHLATLRSAHTHYLFPMQRPARVPGSNSRTSVWDAAYGQVLPMPDRIQPYLLSDTSTRRYAGSDIRESFAFGITR